MGLSNNGKRLVKIVSMYIDFQNCEIQISKDSGHRIVEKINKLSFSEANAVVIVIMVKNQEKYIRKTIESAKKISSDVVVVDTGSTDGTVKASKDAGVTPKYTEWNEDFSYMRNKLMNLFPKNKWIFWLDADEQILGDGELNVNLITQFLDVLFPKGDVAIMIEQHFPNRSSFVLPDRIMRTGTDLKFTGKVHEYPIFGSNYTDDKLRHVKLKLSVINHGLNKAEVKKFNKEERYSKLLKEMIDNEPDNPRWISLVSYQYVLDGYFDGTEYMELLRKSLLLQCEKPVTLNNLRRSHYLKYLLETYATILIQEEQFDEAIKVSKIGKLEFLDDMNFIYYEYLAELETHKAREKILLDKLLIEIAGLNENTVIESHQNFDVIQSLIIKLLFDTDQKDKAKQMAKTLEDNIAIHLVRDIYEIKY